MQKGFITYNNTYNLHYQVFGNGKNTILCYHGFGQNSSVFEKLTQKHPNSRIISFDLPFHGNTSFPHKNLSKSTWREISKLIFDFFQLSKVSIVAYSLGGRFAIRTAIDFTDRVEKLIFIAADGFYLPRIYHIATSWPGKHLFQFVLANPSLLFSTVENLAKVGVTNNSMAKFTKTNLYSEEQRNRVYLSWTHLKPLKTSPLEFAAKMKKQVVSTEIYIGKKDYVIKEVFFDRFFKIYPSALKIVLNKRHHEMIDSYIETPN